MSGAADAALPAERELLALIARHHEAERRVRGLLARAVTGDRRTLIREGLLILAELRRQAPRAGVGLARAYLIAGAATAILLGREVRWPNVANVRDLAGSLVKQVTDALLSAEAGSRRAVAAVTAATLEDRELDAVTALVDDAGRRWPLGVHIETTMYTLGRHGVSRGTVAGVGPGGLVKISSHRDPNPICKDGQTLVVGQDRMPPYHSRCHHLASPAGASVGEHVEAMSEAERLLDARDT